MPVEATQAVNTAPVTTAATPVGGAEMDKASFLKLLVAQMQHQDPLEPMSNTEFVAQLATFSNVEQLMSVNQGIEILQIQNMGLANSQASSFIGKEVEVQSDTIDVSATDAEVTAGFELTGDAATVTVNIRDATGAIVKTIEMGAQEAGSQTVDWDCRDSNGNMVSPGSYRIDVVAEDAEGAPVSWEARIRGVVEGIVYENGYPELLIGSIRAELSEIRAVYPSSADEMTLATKYY